ncbi:MAG TPA: ABC transporter permease [Gaiellaceae bacterium]|nr:ABC transporter permease [Gaiellaceae bacterium]
MALFLVRRLVSTALTVVAVSFVTFVAFGLVLDPSGPMVLDPTPHGHAARVFVQQHYHLEDPILSRYVRWAGGVVQHGFGRKVSTDIAAGSPIRLRTEGERIGPGIWHAAEISAAMVGGALVLVIAGSTLVGGIAAKRRRFRADVSTRFFAYVAAAMPTFLIGDLLKRGVLPGAHVIHGFNGPIATGGGWFLLGAPTGGVVDWVRHLTLPALALAVGLVGVYARYVRSSLLVELAAPYVVVARAKGLPEHTVLLRHALRNALAPLVSLLSLEMGAVIGASLAADGVFGTGGLATYFLNSFGSADPFDLTAVMVVSAIVVCAFALVGDVLVSTLDPRLRAS